ncbi:MAG TPA: sensor histidine kinase [Chitinophagaceae bacterium]|nr:sensor histidine kinase [Chitinophagaceae bacterium]
MLTPSPKPQAAQAKHLDSLLLQGKLASDRVINYFLAAYFFAGLLLALFYDTWSVAIGVGSLSLLAYYAAKWIMPDSNVYQYVLSAVLGIFMAQYIYQMHGMFEMHFVAFISSAVLITYQNWKLQIPITIVVVVHHALFGYLQFIGFEEIYFTKLEYMDLQTFIIHVLLAAVIFFICGLWAHHFKQYKIAHTNQTYELGLLQEKEAHTEERKILEEQVALERAMKQKAITEAVLTAQENERTEIGRELHDNVNQILAAARLYIEMARKDKEGDDSLLARSATYTQSAIEEIRKLAKALITPLIKDTGLIDPIKGLIEDIMAVHPIEIELTVTCLDEDLFNEKFKLNLFRIIQEQINNTLKHANASKIKIDFTQSGGQLFIVITDNGIGFDTSKRKKGVGLINITSRVELYKGNVIINSKPGEGCNMAICFSMAELSRQKALNKDTPDSEAPSNFTAMEAIPAFQNKGRA